jgi:hypothetical protein
MGDRKITLQFGVIVPDVLVCNPPCASATYGIKLLILIYVISWNNTKCAFAISFAQLNSYKNPSYEVKPHSWHFEHFPI